MSTDVQTIERKMRERFEHAGLSPFLVEHASELVDLDGKVHVEIVLSDRSKLNEASELMKEILQGESYSLVVRPKWTIDKVGNPSPAYATDGGVRAAVLIPVTLRSGTERVIVTVAVTKAAEWEFESALGRRPDLQQVARVVVESALRRGGRSFWNPTQDSYLEVAAGSVANISRLLKAA